MPFLSRVLLPVLALVRAEEVIIDATAATAPKVVPQPTEIPEVITSPESVITDVKSDSIPADAAAAIPAENAQAGEATPAETSAPTGEAVPTGEAAVETPTGETPSTAVETPAETNSTAADGSETTSNTTAVESISANLTFAFIQDPFDGITFPARMSGETIRGNKARTFRLGNIELVGDDRERQMKAFKKKASRGLVLVKVAPEEAQFFPEAERNATYHRQLEREQERLSNKYKANVEGVELRKEDEDVDADENGVWRNITVADVWAYDGTHLASALAYSYPTLFKFSATPYAMHEDVDRARLVDDELPAGTPNPNYHILTVGSNLKRQKSMAKIAKIMKELSLVDKNSTMEAAKHLGLDMPEEKNSEGTIKLPKKKDLTEEEEFTAQFVGAGVVIVLVLGACWNFGRGPINKGKLKPSKKFIEKELNSLEYTRTAKCTNKKSKYGPKPEYLKKDAEGAEEGVEGAEGEKDQEASTAAVEGGNAEEKTVASAQDGTMKARKVGGA